MHLPGKLALVCHDRLEFTGDSIPPVLTVLSTTRKEIADMPPHTVWECMLAESCKLVTLSADDRRFESTTWSEAITELADRLEIDMYRTYGITGDMLQQAIRAFFLASEQFFNITRWSWLA
jgi:hypothetical protein